MMNTASDKVVPTLLLDIRSLPHLRQVSAAFQRRVTTV
jgi:hypothetical protein